EEADLEAQRVAREPGVDGLVERRAVQHPPEDDAGSEEREQHREDRSRVRALACEPAPAEAGDERTDERRKSGGDGELFHPRSESRSSTSMLLILRNSTTRIARPIADSAAATVRMKNTNTCPAALSR